MRRHKPMRVWYAPWKKKCAAGCEWFPCPDVIQVNHQPEPAGWNQGTTVLPAIAYRPAVPLRDERPLMTPGQEWRSR